MPALEGLKFTYVTPLGTERGGDVSRGFRQGWEEAKGTGYGAFGLAGAILGIDRMKEWGLENAEERFDVSQALSRPTDQLEGIEDVGSAVDWAQRGLGYVGAQAVPSLVTGGVGATVGRTAVGKTVQALMRRGLQREAQDLLAKAGTRGAITGAGLTSYAQEAGSIYPEMVSEGFDEPSRAALFAVPAAALDVIPEARAARKILMPAGAGKPRGILRTMAVEAAKQGGIEGGTEMGQTAVERAAAYKPLTGPEAYSEYANAGALGFLGGGALGGGMAPFTGPTELLPDVAPPAEPPIAPAGPPALPPPGPAPLALPPAQRSNRINYVVDQDGNVIEATRAAAPDPALPPPAPYAPPGIVETPRGFEHLTEKPMTAGPLGVARTPQAYQNAEVASRIAGLPVGPQEAPVLPERVAGHPAYTDDRAAGPVPPLGVMPKVSPAAAVVPPKGVAPTLPSWKGAARRAFVSARGRKAALINEIVGQADPQAAAQITRERAYETQSAAELKALDAVHKAITGQTFDEFDAADKAAAEAAVPTPVVKTPVDEAAHQAAASPLNDKVMPSKAQAESGNYAKGALKLGGMDISIENPQGSVRQDKATPSKWKQVMRDHYGYVKGTVGFDKDHLDVFVKPGTPEDWAGTVYVVNQTDRNGKFDEHKAVLGAKSRVDATKIYLRNYPKGQAQNIRSIVEMPLEGFKAWARDTSKKGPKGGELQARSELTENVEKAEAPQVDATEQARRAWEEDRLDGDPTFDELTLAHQQRVEGAIEDGTWSGATMNEIIDSYKRARRTDRANRAAAEGRAADEKILKPTTRGRKKGAGNAETVRGDEGQVREGSAEVQRGVQRGADEGRQDLQRDQEEDGAEAGQPSLWDETVAAAQRGEIQESIKKPSERGDGGARRAAFTRIIKGLTGDTESWKITFYDTLEDAQAAVRRGLSKRAAEFVGHSDLKKGTQAWVEEGHAYFILSDIKPGDELAVFLHEVGKHLGMERLLTQEALDRLASRVREWALRDDGSLESKVAAKALERVKLTGNESDVRRNQDGYWRVYNKDGDLVKGIMEKTEEAAVRKGGLYAAGLHEHQSEAVAYFIEEAVKAGVDPTAMSYKTPIGRWMRELWTLFKTALRKLGLKNVDALKAQDVVDLAYGAARGILQTRWHGSPAHFRKFNSKSFRGTGEGRMPLNEDRSDYRDMIAWGTYLADREGTAKEYRDRLGGDRIRLGDGRVLEANEEFWTSENEAETPYAVAFGALMRSMRSGYVSDPIYAAKLYIDDQIKEAQDIIERHEANPNSSSEEAVQMNTELIASMTEAKAMLNEWGRSGTPTRDTGALYATDVTIANDEWLDWEKGGNQQSKRVQDGLRAAFASAGEELGTMPSDSAKVLYEVLEQKLGSQKAASELLDKYGIKGVRYLDAGSRNAGPKTINIQAPFSNDKVTLDPSRTVLANDLERTLRQVGALDNTVFPKNDVKTDFFTEWLAHMIRSGRSITADAFASALYQQSRMKDNAWQGATELAALDKKLVAEDVAKVARYIHVEKPPKPTYNYVVFNDKNIVTVKKDPKGASTVRQQSIADVPPVLLAKTQVEIEVYDTAAGKFVKASYPADQALASIDEDIATFKNLITCLRG